MDLAMKQAMKHSMDRAMEQAMSQAVDQGIVVLLFTKKPPTISTKDTMPSEEVLGQITATTSTSTYQQTTEIATESEQNTINTEDRQSLRFANSDNRSVYIDRARERVQRFRCADEFSVKVSASSYKQIQ